MAVGDVIPKTFFSGALTTTLTTTLITPDANKRLIIEKIFVSNAASAARAVTIDRYNGTTGFKILNAVSIAANTTQEIPGPIVLDSSTILLRGGQGTGTDVEVNIFGLEESLT